MSKRIEWIDSAKGLGIILVIYGHISFRPETLNVWLCSFHMPLFFFLAGVTLNPESLGTFGPFLKNKFKTLVVPYFILAIANWGWKFVTEMIRYLLTKTPVNYSYLGKQAVGILIQVRGTAYGPGVWFVPCIFVTFLLYWLIVKVSRGRKQIVAACAGLSLVVGYLYCTYIGVKLPWSVDAALIAVFFMSAGNLLRPWLCQSELKQRCTRGGDKSLVLYAEMCGTLLLNGVFAYLNYQVLHRTVGMWSNNYGNLMYFLLAAIAGIFFTILLANCVSIKELQFIGRNSLFYYGVHQILIEIISMLAGKIPGLSNDVFAFAVSTLVMLGCVICLRWICPVYNLICRKVLLAIDQKIKV